MNSTKTPIAFLSPEDGTTNFFESLLQLAIPAAYQYTLLRAIRTDDHRYASSMDLPWTFLGSLDVISVVNEVCNMHGMIVICDNDS